MQKRGVKSIRGHMSKFGGPNRISRYVNGVRNSNVRLYALN